MIDTKRDLAALVGDDFPFFDVDEAYDQSFTPISFTFAERRSGSIFIGDGEPAFDEWIANMINEYISRCVIDITPAEAANLSGECMSEIDRIMTLTYRGRIIADTVWNQEVPDIVCHIVRSTAALHGYTLKQSHEEFNELAFELVPRALDKLLSERRLHLPELMRLSIAAGSSGLDLKGASSAASAVPQTGIPLAQLLGRPISERDIDSYIGHLKRMAERPSPLFEIDSLLEEISHSSLFLWFTDDVIESFFDLLFIQELLSMNGSASVCVVPKSGSFGNDLSVQQLIRMLQHGFFRGLRESAVSGRFFWTGSGPSMAALNLSKLSPEVRGLLHQADLAVIKGCRAFELAHGGLRIPLYNAFVVARTLSERISGLSCRQSPTILFRLDGHESAYWGIFRRRAVGQQADCASSNIMDTIRRRKMTGGLEMTEELAKMLNTVAECSPADRDAAQRAAIVLAERLIDLTVATYDRRAAKYTEIRWAEPHELDKKLWSELLECYGNVSGSEKPRLLDIATGNGRDLDYAQNVLGIDAVGVEKSRAFVHMIEKKIAGGTLASGSVIECDMRDLSVIADCSFDIVRQNASLLHLPVIAVSTMADLAVSESYRVLKPGGLLFVMTKEGDGLQFVDTGEGLGGRFFQFHTFASLASLLERNGFWIRKMARENEVRGNKEIPWLYAIAVKKRNS